MQLLYATLKVWSSFTRPLLLLIYVAEEKGYFAALGISVEPLTVGSAMERDQLMQAGRIDGVRAGDLAVVGPSFDDLTRGHFPFDHGTWLGPPPSALRMADSRISGGSRWTSGSSMPSPMSEKVTSM